MQNSCKYAPTTKQMQKPLNTQMNIKLYLKVVSDGRHIFYKKIDLAHVLL